MKSIKLSIIASLYIIFSLLIALTSFAYVVSVLLSEKGMVDNTWFNIINVLVSYFVPNALALVSITIGIALMIGWASFKFLQRRSWTRPLFFVISAVLFPWVGYRLVVTLLDIPFYVSFSAIFGSNPLTKYPSMIFYLAPIIFIGCEVLFLATIKVLLNSQVALEFKKR